VYVRLFNNLGIYLAIFPEVDFYYLVVTRFAILVMISFLLTRCFETFSNPFITFRYPCPCLGKKCVKF
jgi:hypothetical protein